MLHGLSHFMACQGHQRFLLSLEPFVCNTLKSAVILKKSGTELTDEASSVIFLITLNMKQWNQILNNTTFCSVPCTVFSWDFPQKPQCDMELHMKCYCSLDDLFIIFMCHDSTNAPNGVTRPKIHSWGPFVAHPGHGEDPSEVILRHWNILKCCRDVGLVSQKEHLRSWRDQ